MTGEIQKRKSWLKELNFQMAFPFLGLIFIVVLFAILTKGRIFSAVSLKAVVNDGIYILLGTIGFVFLFAVGCIDFSIGYNMGLSCTVACLAAIHIGIYAALPAAVLTGIVIGLVNGEIVTKAKIEAFISTMGTMFILQGVVLVVLNGSVLQAPLAMNGMYTTSFKVGVILSFSIVAYILFEKTVFGRLAKAIGACPEAVRQTGINADRYKVIIYILMGAIAGFLGYISLIRTSSASGSTGSSLMFDVLNAALLGGVPMTGGATTKMRGAFLGALTIAFMTTGMTILRISTQNQQFIQGIIFLIAVGISFDRKNIKVVK